MISSNACAACGGKCCLYPALRPDEYIRMSNAIGNDKLVKTGILPLDNGWLRLKGPCPALTDHGCALSYEDRPIVCKIYPWMLIPSKRFERPGHFEKGVWKEDNAPGDRGLFELFLDVKYCPAWKVFGELYEESKKEIDGWIVKKNGER